MRKMMTGLFMVLVMVMTLHVNVEAKGLSYDELATYFKELSDKEIEEGIEEEFEDAIIDASEVTYTSSIDKIEEGIYKYKVNLKFEDNGDEITIMELVYLHDCKTKVDVDNQEYSSSDAYYTFNGRRVSEYFVSAYFDELTE